MAVATAFEGLRLVLLSKDRRSEDGEESAGGCRESTKRSDIVEVQRLTDLTPQSSPTMSGIGHMGKQALRVAKN